MVPVGSFEPETLERARLSRDPRFDGRFFAAVKTTGNYCRPICPCQNSKPQNVLYFPTAAAAAEAGFRPCVRCRPEAAPGTPVWLGTSAVVRRAMRLIQNGFLDTSSVNALAEALGIGPRHLHRLFMQHLGASPIVVAQTRRVHFAKQLIDDTNLPMTEIALAAGFASLRRFNDSFKTTYGRAPSELRRLRQGGIAPDTGEVVLRLSYRPPFDWSQMLGFLAARAIPGVERVKAGAYSRTIAIGQNEHAVVRVSHVEPDCLLEVRVRGAAPEDLYRISLTARRAFDLTADPASILAGLQSDRLLFPLTKEQPGVRVPGVWDPFECAVRAILLQQIGVLASRPLLARLVAQAGRRLAVACDGLTHVFPSPAALVDLEPGALGLPPGRGEAVLEVARAVVDGRLDFEAPLEDARSALAELPSCGYWTAQCVALHALGDPDAFPATDEILRRAAAEDGEPLSTTELARRAEAWRPWRGYAALHLWWADARGRLSQPNRAATGHPA